MRGLLAAGLFGAVAAWQSGSPAPGAAGQATSNDLSALPTAAPAPADNPSSVAKAELGRLLFWGPTLPGPCNVSCASCHHPATAYADALDLSVGPHGREQGGSGRFHRPDNLPLVRGYAAGPRGGRASLNPNVPASHLEALLPTRVTSQAAFVVFLNFVNAGPFGRAVLARVSSGSWQPFTRGR